MKHAKHKIILVGLALLLNGIFLWHYDASQYFAISQLHGQIGYNIVQHCSYNINSEVTEYCGKLQQKEGRLIDYHEIMHQDFGKPQNVFPINDTIGYGILLGMLWKLTSSFGFFDVQLLHIIIYALLMIIFYHIALLLFGNTTVALYCGISQLFFFPLIWLNVQPVRDVWAYYGLLVLLYGVLQFLLQFQQFKSWFVVAACGTFFSICQFIRPSVFLALITLSVVSILYACYAQQIKKVIAMLLLVWSLNGLFFWVPFFTYNLHTYNRWFVGPVGQDLLEGLGEFENPWGYHLCDRWLANYVGKKYNVVYGTPTFDDAAKKEFYTALYTNPLFYISTIIQRIPQVILPALPWMYCHDCAMSLKLQLSKWYIRLFLFFGYLGFLSALIQKRYFFLIVVIGLILGGLGKLPSHIEYRYLIPFYWVFSLGIGWLYKVTNQSRIF